MSSETPTAPPSKTMFWAGWVLTVVVGLMMIMSGVMKLNGSEQVVEGFAHLGWPDKLALGLGIVEISCAVIYLIPQTTVLGAILLTGYLGGAIATHVRIGEGIIVQFALGVVVWLGIYLRDPRIRSLLPFRI